MGLFEIGKAKVLGLELIQDALGKVNLTWERLEAAQNRQKTYADNRWCDLEFAMADMVFLNVSPMKRKCNI